MNSELNSKLESIETEMDIRVESLVATIHDYRDECKKKLDFLKNELKKYFWCLNKIMYKNTDSIDLISRTMIAREKTSKCVIQSE